MKEKKKRRGRRNSNRRMTVEWKEENRGGGDGEGAGTVSRGGKEGTSRIPATPWLARAVSLLCLHNQVSLEHSAV